VRRRFYQQAGTTRSRTEVVAHKVIPVRQQRRVAAVLTRAAADLHPGPRTT
jgi:hypothetical protein